MSYLTRILCVLSLVFAGSAVFARSGGPAPGTQQDIAALAQGIMALGAEVDPEEAMRAARVTYEYTYQLSKEYQITDGPLVHNAKVNMGKRPRGLCWHWAQDIEARLKQENFKTLDLHRAVANSFNIRLEHSTALISKKGDHFKDGIVLDPWRKAGVLFWTPTAQDRRYEWMPRDEVLAIKRQQKQRVSLSTKSRPTNRLRGADK